MTLIVGNLVAGNDAALDALQTMLRAMTRAGGAAASVLQPAEDVAFGAVVRDAEAGRGVARLGASAIAFEGELHRDAPTAQVPAAANGAQPDDDAAYLLRGYLERGVSFLTGLEGRFNAALWLGDKRQLVLITDKFGSRPFFVSQHDGRLAFASQIKALLALPGASRQLNRRGLVEFFSFGQFWNHDTLFTGIQSVGVATHAVYDAATGRLQSSRYWQPRPTGRLTAAESLEALDARLKLAVDRRTHGASRLGLSLSGGLDARTVLGLVDTDAIKPTCVSLGMEGSLDQRSARRLAELVACDYHTLVLDQDFLANFEQHLVDMVDLTDGHYLSQCIVMPTLPLYARLGVATLLRGHAGELIHLRKAYNFSLDDSVLTLRDAAAVHDWLFPRLQSHLTAGVEEPMIRGVGHDEFQALAHDALREGLTAASHFEHPVDRISQLFLDQRTHRETAVSLAKIGSVVDVRVPYLDGAFVEAVFSTPIELRMSERIQTHILQQRRPEFLAPPNSNTGAPVGAGPLHRAFCYYRMKVLAKLGVKGYQPYERLGLWLRRELKPLVERLLLAPECLDRGVLEPDAVRGAVERHFAGAGNHTFLLLAMMILETGFRRFLDASPTAAPAPVAPSGASRPSAPTPQVVH
jgi:asparagine synthase (glutamine-hydrolysing)